MIVEKCRRGHMDCHFDAIAFFWNERKPPASYRMMDPTELGRMIDRHASPLTLYARQWCSAPDDVVQEAFVKLACQTPKPADPAAWLFRVVRNTAISAARATKRRRFHETQAGLRVQSWFADDRTQLDGEAVTAALDSLPIEQREVIIAHLWGDLSFEQIAVLIDSSASTAHRWYMTGLNTLRERLGARCATRKPPTPN